MMTLAAALFGEFLIGLALGWLSGIPFMTVETSGHIMGYMMGFQIAQAFNPELESNLNVIGSLLFYMAVSAFIMIGGLELTHETLLFTFERVPAGAFVATDVPLELFVGMVAASFDMAISIAAPVLGSGFLLLLSLGFLMKTMPQLNIMTMGFSLKIMVGTITYPASTGRNFDEILRVIDSLQLTDYHKVATPANWQDGGDCVVVPSISTEDAKQQFPKGVTEVKPYLRMTPQPNK
ncbi:MAG: flagellar biosynthetic protein FliR [Cyanobacteria bacterium P01_A01_bin.105]